MTIPTHIAIPTRFGGKQQLFEYFIPDTFWGEYDGTTISNTFRAKIFEVGLVNTNEDHFLTSINIILKRNGDSGIMNCYIYEVVADLPTSNPISSGSLNQDQIPTEIEWVSVPMTNVLLSKGTKYALVIRFPDNISAILLITESESGGQQPYNSLNATSEDGILWNSYNTDIGFKIYGKKIVNVAVPTHISNNYLLRYEADALPQDSTPTWSKTGSFDTEEITSGKLHIGDSSIVRYVYESNDLIPSNNIMWLETRVKMVSATNRFIISLYPNVNEFVGYLAGASIQFFVDKVTLGDAFATDTTDIEMDTTDDYHIYKCYVNKDTQKVGFYIDDVFIGEVNLLQINNGTYDRVEMIINNAESYIDYVRVFQKGATHITTPTR